MQNTRNFSIVAHVDHGKSTLSDRFIQYCGGLNAREMVDQVLDTMTLERERGITIKSQNVTLNYRALNSQVYKLNLIDTPGHIDFSHEVSRSLAACEGILLLIDISKGIESQTLFHYHSAVNMNLKVIPVLNKVDLGCFNANNVVENIRNVFSSCVTEIIYCSGKTGLGIVDVLESLVHNVPCPQGDRLLPLQALIVDAWFDNYLGVTLLVCVKNGILRKDDTIQMMRSGYICSVDRVGIFTPKSVNLEKLDCGDIGWITCFIKDVAKIIVGDTITIANEPASHMLPNFKKIIPKVYAGFFPVCFQDYALLRCAIKKLSVNDFSLYFKSEYSTYLGYGYKCGFLGLLHMEVVQERLYREYNLNLIVTPPAVLYEILQKNYTIVYVDNPSNLPAKKDIIEFREPIVTCYILFSVKYIGKVIALCVYSRGVQIDIIYIGNQVKLIYDIPMSEIIVNFFNKLQVCTHGYVSFDYFFKCFRISDMEHVEIFICKKNVDVLGFIAHRDSSMIHKIRRYIHSLQSLIPRQQFDIVIQAIIGKRTIFSVTVKQFRKNVLEKCSGGDVSRKKKLLKKQKSGKKRMKVFGNFVLTKKFFFDVMNMHCYLNKK
ncbi:MAG: elongation factor 4 [Candidatus Westeberhardia cardiocondylae]|nr:elongation factor 4 [Candidatus Westeberhardia cardiocondylae]